MDWFIAKIVFRIVCGDGNHQAQFDEQLRLIAAQDRQGALAKAKTLGEKVQERFLNQHQQWVNWQFVAVTEITPLDNLDDETEVHFQVTEPENVAHYLTTVYQKAAFVARNVTLVSA
jgi:hypothetical protein